jgi:hypothetical protein
MNKCLQRVTLVAGLLLTTMRVVASPDIDSMTDKEVTEYAIRISDVMQQIQLSGLCMDDDVTCLRVELQRFGIAHEDRNSVQKRLVLMLGSIH